MVNLLLSQFTAIEHRLEHRLLGKLVHAHQMVNYRPIAPTTCPFRRTMHRHDVDIDIAGQPAIQAHFLVAKVLAALRRAEIYKAIIYGLF